ncbi:glucose-1-phosphate adenylyltransferase [Klebsiella pneumoniae]|uniref:Glucose-1-phosphate adenylyltransferase n=1 Tax=Klebsiella pneumoniae TaxID=573 RepID=A0A2X3EXB1_KLEPN|nr:glucose-1-phosphate adenylyltransferase [Klebsiella pneumoniae]
MVRLEKNDPLMLARQLPIKSVALILAGGRGTRLKDLTIKRAKPAVHFGGKFRIIDFALSNCINSGIRRIGVITQYQSHTLVQHIQRGWSFFSEEMNEFVDLLPAQQRVHGRKLVSRHGGCGDAEPGYHQPLQGRVRGDPRGRPYL